MRLTKRIWRWELNPHHQIANDSGWSWIRPEVYLMSFEEVIWQTLNDLQARQTPTDDDIAEATNKNRSNLYWDGF